MKFLKSVLSFFCLFLFITYTYAYAGESFYYTNQSLNAFSVVIDSVDGRNINTQNDPRSMLSNNMRNLVKQRSAVRDAQITFDGFKNNKDETIKQSATLISGSLLMLGMTMDNTIDLIEKMLNMSDKEFISNSGTFTKKTAELTDAMNKNWKLYAQTSISVTYTLIDGMSDVKNANPNTKLSKLNISKIQLNELKSTIKSKFSKQVNQKDKNKLAWVDMPPVFLLDFLSDSWKTSD
ncbi:hypothetical protein DPM18_03235 [Polynucleobacter paneuropaeus]|uniref:hypothetical protein n=1 Tax=Polynucleobacter paneuropaeus TaxID=2527775 RepID=UPI000DBF3775|nr:hypothetical protein [Polynucleobacter paneuropaeus]AWW45911.1 hypothetical protein DPM18_03235 [Polynucleobacter paneuropaeus]